MILLGYIGTHESDGLSARLGRQTIRWAQRGYSAPARDITHTELMLGGTPTAAIIGSSSLVDDNGDGKGGVRVKHGVDLKPWNWKAMQLPERFDVHDAARWFSEHDGEPYDTRGAAGSVGQALVQQRDGTWFCSEACAAAMGLPDAHMLNPAALWTVGLILGGVDITDDFFGIAEAARWD